ncbi:MAG: pyridoxal phosphate-dependent aminotransferase [Acidobacteriota bacterium]
MSTAPLPRLRELLPPELLRIVERDTPIPRIAGEAGRLQPDHPELVRADIGQISGYDPKLEVPYGAPVGLERLRELVAETMIRSLQLDDSSRHPHAPELSARNICACTGAAEALSLLLRCFAKDATVALPRAHWENYANAVDLAGGRHVIVDVFEKDGRLDTDALAGRLRDADVSVVVANFPSNPSGAVLDDAECAALAGVMRDLNLVVIADEVYFRLRYDGHAPNSLLAHAPDHVISVSSASKEYLLPGARIGYVVSAHADLTDVVLRKLLRASTASPNVLGQRRLIELLERDLVDLQAGRDPKLVGAIRDEMARRRDQLLEVLDRHGMSAAGRPGHRPEGTIFLLASLPSWFDGDDAAFASATLEHRCVSVVPGSAFGLPGTVRFSYGGLTQERITQLDANLTQLRQALS